MPELPDDLPDGLPEDDLLPPENLGEVPPSAPPAPDTRRKTKNADEVDEIVNFTACLLGTLKRKGQIKKALRQRYANHNFSARTLEAYLARARARVQKWAGREREQVHRQVAAALQSWLRITPKLGEQLSVIDRLFTLYGLAAPSRHELTGKDGGALQVEEQVQFYLPDNSRGDGPPVTDPPKPEATGLPDATGLENQGPLG